MSPTSQQPTTVGAAKRRRWPRRALIVSNILVLVVLVAAGSAYTYARSLLGKAHHIKVEGIHPLPSLTSPMTILAVGSDTRSLGKGANAAFGAPDAVTGQRSDTIMLIRVVPATSSIAIMSIPRDLLVPIAGLGTTRINAAFNSGPNLLVSTVESDFGIQVNHFMVVNFYTFTQIANSLGGVYQYFPTPARDLYSGLTVTKPGCVLLKGANALGFVRSREYQYYLDGSWQYQLAPESDLARIQRQQDFIKLAVKKAESINLLNLGEVNSVLSGVTSSLTVDSSFSTSLMLRLAETFRHANVNGIANWTYPTVNSTEVPGALDPDTTADQAMLHQFLNYGLPSAAAGTSGTSGASGATATTSAAASPGGRTKTSAVGSEVQLALDVYTAGALQAAPVATATAGTSPVGETTPADEIEADGSSYYHGQYVPPGRLAGQVPQQCPS